VTRIIWSGIPHQALKDIAN